MRAKLKSIISAIRSYFKQLSCRHEYGWFEQEQKIPSRDGRIAYYACPKCGKIKERRFIPYMTDADIAYYLQRYLRDAPPVSPILFYFRAHKDE